MDVSLLKWLLALLVVVIHSQGSPSPINVAYPVAEENLNPFIGHLLADAGVQAPPGSQVQLQILRGDYLELFYIEGDKLMTKHPLDRESLCEETHPCIIQLDITVLINSQLNWILNVQVNVLDINDNSPVFTEQNVTIEIPEESEIGTTFDLPVAMDRDIGQNSIRHYVISPDMRNTFSIHNNEAPDGSTIPKLVLNRELRRDETGEVLFQLISYDDGTPLKSGSVWITVNIISSNDHPPQFSQETYAVTVNENSRPDHLIRIEASDVDTGNNGDISYSFNNNLQMSHDGVLSINKASGDVTLLKQLDHEERPMYRYIILATDHGTTPLSTSTDLIINVKDINDSPPQININTLTRANYSEIAENSPLGTFIALITAADADSGQNAQVNCTASTTSFQLRLMYGNTHQLITASQLDFEARQNYSVEIVCVDRGDPPLTVSSSLDIYVSDVNDNSPVFQRAVYNISIEENLPVHTEVLRVIANDIDSGENGRINYSLEGDNVQRWLSVDSATGVISTSVSFDYELEAFAHIQFSVIASDNGTPPQKSSVSIDLHVLDTNDEAPIFFGVRTFRVSEYAEIGTSLGRVQAKDADSPPFNIVEYFINNDTFDSRSFSIDRNTGEIKTSNPLDREHRPSYLFEVIARDTFEPFHTSRAEVTVYVADENDNVPVVTFPTLENNTVHISLESKGEFLVTQIIASDSDSRMNSKLLYTVLNGDERKCFKLQKDNGLLYVNGSCLETEKKEEYILNIMVEDMGKKPKAVYPILYVIVDQSTFVVDTGDGVVNTTKAGIWRLEYHHKVSLVLASLTVLMLIILVSVVVIIKAKQRKQRNACAKYMDPEEMTRLRRNSFVHSNAPHQTPDTGPTHQHEPVIGPEMDQGAGDTSEGQFDTSYGAPNTTERYGDSYSGGPENAEDNNRQDNYGHPQDHQTQPDAVDAVQHLPDAMRLPDPALVRNGDGTPADMQLYKLLRFLNEVQRNEQQMVSSTTESTNNMTELSAPDSGTGMSEEEHFDDSCPSNSAIKSPPKSPSKAPCFPANRREMVQAYSNPPMGYANARSPVQPRYDTLRSYDFYHQIPSTHNQIQPKIVINTRQKSRNYKPNSFNLKSPRKTIAKMKLLQSFSNGSQSPKENVADDRGCMYTGGSIADRSVSTESSTPSPSSSVQSMNSAQTFRNSRKPVTLGTFKPELCQDGYVQILQPVEKLLHPVETNL